jgi:hypothetical protein
MSVIGGNNSPIISNLVYALDFSNPYVYNSNSTSVNSLVYSAATGSLTKIYYSPAVERNALQLSTPNRLTQLPNTGQDTIAEAQYISLNNVLPVLTRNSSFTVSWLAQPKNTDLGVFASQNNSNVLLYIALGSTTCTVGFYDSGSGNVFSGKIYTLPSASNLQLYTWTYSSGSSTLYINNTPVTASATTQSYYNSSLQASLSNNFVINGQLNRTVTAKDQWSGSLGALYVYNKTLSWDEINQNYLQFSRRFVIQTPITFSLDPDVYSFTRYSSITDSITQTALNNFVLGLKSSSLWDKMLAVYPFVNTISSSIRNLKDAGIYPLVLNNSWSFSSSSGLFPSSSNSFITTQAVPPIVSHQFNQHNYNYTSSHISYLSYDTVTTASVLVGSTKNSNFISATGGIITNPLGKIVHTFTASGTFTALTDGYVDVLVVAGGGSGGTAVSGGGGGGGVVFTSSLFLTAGTYPIIVGGGGVASPGTTAIGNNGQTSSFANIIALGGGGGATQGGNARNGGNGGGGSNYGGGGTFGTGSTGQGNSGFNPSSAGYANTGGGGGGGGAGQPGGTSQNQGGAGFETTITGEYKYFGAGGGGGVSNTTYRGGFDGGGDGGGNGANGIDYTGGGGGGSYAYNVRGGSGGSGSVIISYSTTPYTSSFAIYADSTSITGSINNIPTSGITTSGPLGLITVSRTGSNSLTITKNSTITSFTVPASGALSSNLYLGAINNNNTASAYSPYNIAYASVGTGLTTNETLTYNTLVSKLQYDLGRGLLIEGFPAAAAYSVRQLSKTAQYSMEVRRDWDNASSSFGFTSNGDLDTGSLLAFITGSAGTGSGFVKTWYDQSGNNRHATQTATGSQPLILSSGSIITLYGKPTLQFDGVDDGFNIDPAPLSFSNNSTHYFVHANTGGGTIFGTSAYRYGRFDSETSTAFGSGTGTSTTTFQDVRQGLITFTQTSTTAGIRISKNSVDVTTTAAGTSGGSMNKIGYTSIGGNYYIGKISEIISTSSYTSPENRAPIESNINSYFNIY